jgi:hypothetical protein
MFRKWRILLWWMRRCANPPGGEAAVKSCTSRKTGGPISLASHFRFSTSAPAMIAGKIRYFDL